MITLSIFDVIYLLTSILGTYIVYRLMHIFFRTTSTRRNWELLSYLGYLIIGDLIYLSIKTPIVMMIFNLLSFFALTFNYVGNVKKKLLTTMYAYLFLFCIEMVIVSLTGYIKFSIWKTIQFDSIFTVVSIKIISYAMVLAVSKLWKSREGETLPPLYWLSIFFIPVASLYLLLILFSSSQIYQVNIVISVMLILLINFLVFYLYESIIKEMSKNTKKLFFEQQSQYYKKQLDLIQSSTKQTNQLQHDMKNHLLMFQALYENGEIQEGSIYMTEVLSGLNQTYEYANSGNVVIDSILNFKLAEAKSLEACIDVDIKIPHNLNLSTFTLTTILGNLLDNAITALKKSKGRRRLEIKIIYSKGNIIFQIANSFDGQLIEKNNCLLTTKQEKNNHGFGLENVISELSKCNGEIFIEHENNLFSVKVLLTIG